MPSGLCASTASATLAGMRSCDRPLRTTRRKSCVTHPGNVTAVVILAATAGHRLQRAQHAPIQIALDLSGHRQRTLARVEGEQERCAAILRHRCDHLLRRGRQRQQMFTRRAVACPSSVLPG